MKPHSREKRVIDKKVEVTKKPVNNETPTQRNTNTLFNVFRRIVKKWEEKKVAY